MEFEPKKRKISKKGVSRYPFDKCEHSAITSNSKHEEVRYSCDKCDYAATDSSNLRRHIESKHEGVRYPCDK